GRHSFGTGALLGISVWANPSLQGLGLAIPIFWLISKGMQWKKVLLVIVLFAIGVTIIVAPWTIRNYIKLDAFVPLRSAFSYNMWRGNHVGATGTVRTFAGTDIDEAVSPEYRAYYEAHMVPDEIARDRFFAGEVKKFISEHPDEYISLCLTRLYYIWWRDMTHPLTAHPAYIVPWIFILIFSSIGLLLSKNNWREWSLWIFQILGFTVMFSLTIVLPRYRMPIYPAMFLLAAMGIDYLISKSIETRG
ncbi:hypothetical protein KJ564_07110, partial [bacterium]|nr:hypothetical protein [bacterium]